MSDNMTTKGILNQDTVIKTNLITVIAVITAIVGAFVSYTIAINRIQTNETSITELDQRVDRLEGQNIDIQKLLVEISTDVKAIKESR